MNTPRPVPEKFLVAFSFAGEQRDLIRSIAEAVEQRLGCGCVFFDEWYEHLIAGDDADLRLQEIYGQKTELVVACVSARYGAKKWTKAATCGSSLRRRSRWGSRTTRRRRCGRDWRTRGRNWTPC